MDKATARRRVYVRLTLSLTIRLPSTAFRVALVLKYQDNQSTG